MMNVRRTVVLCSGNKGKLTELAGFLARYGCNCQVVAPVHPVDVVESLDTLAGNAELKLKAYVWANACALPGTLFVADDTGLFIDHLGGEPGIKVRRWKGDGREMGDEEIRQYALELLRDVSAPLRTATLRTAVAFCVLGTQKKPTRVMCVTSELKGLILHAVSGEPIPGLLFSNLFYIPKLQLMLGDLQPAGSPEVLTHRQRAFMLMAQRAKLLPQ